jgi:hypothetical protein
MAHTHALVTISHGVHSTYTVVSRDYLEYLTVLPGIGYLLISAMTPNQVR